MLLRRKVITLHRKACLLQKACIASADLLWYPAYETYLGSSAVHMDTGWMNDAEANQILSISRPAEQLF